jgi:transcriptional regulator with GAF, ATPase, and Fis domain
MSSFPLGKHCVVIGRSEDCDVSIAHPALSRRHAELCISPRVSVQDLGSTNGTSVARETHRGGPAIPLGLRESFSIGPFSFLLLPERPPAEAPARFAAAALVIDDPTIAGVPPVVGDVAASEANVLVLGETGVGKELLADTVHRLSKRPGPLLRLNCTTLSESLLESELFGHERGAFTGATTAKPGLLEAARRGTVFLDEIGDLPMALQPKLLRAVEAGEILRVGGLTPTRIDVRFVAATNRDLIGDVGSGRFRADLYYRLDGVTLRIPPLRERRAMIVPLALSFLAARGASATPAYFDALAAHHWPGNVRELKAVVERSVLFARGRDLEPAHLVLAARSERGAAVAAPAEAAAPVAPPRSELTPEETADRDRIVAALDACAGNQTRAAKQLGVARSTLTAKLARYRIRRPRGR